MKVLSPYRGARRKLVLAFDVGTTYSGVSYSILDPGQVPEIRGVTKFPAQEFIGGASKIPSLIYYDKEGRVKAVGAEAKCDGILEQAAEEEWSRAEWFKLHLRPKSQYSLDLSRQIPPIPDGKTAVEVLADFLRYLFKCATDYIQEIHANGAELWEHVQGDIEYILSHPNGWEGLERQKMREAAVMASLVPSMKVANEKISFVTEGEASLHFSIHNGLPAGAIKNNEGIIIVDAGGGTIDLSAYCRAGEDFSKKDVFEEIAVPQCHLSGSLTVTFNARQFLEDYLAESDYLEDLDHILETFDKTTKVRFRHAEDAQYIRFGNTRDNDRNCNIRFGQLKLKGSDVAHFFEPSVECIIKAVLEQREAAHQPISHVVLVGGFSASDWLFNQVSLSLNPKGLKVVRPDNHVNKAVSDGAISFHLDHFVRTRVAKATYGELCSTPYDPGNPSHVKRVSRSFISPIDGTRDLLFFNVILAKNTQVKETTEFQGNYLLKKQNIAPHNLHGTTCRIMCYRGDKLDHYWKDEDVGMYSTLCEIYIDDLPADSFVPKFNEASSRSYYYYQMPIRTILSFGMTEFKAQISWNEYGHEHRTPATIIYEPENDDLMTSRTNFGLWGS